VAPSGDDESIGGKPVCSPERQQGGERTDWEGEHAEDDERDDVACRDVGDPDDDPGHSQDRELAGGEVPEQTVVALDIRGDAHAAPGALLASTHVIGAHLPTPERMALAPL
jgi:hypothetical protein